MTDDPSTAETELTEDGIPLVVNGRRLTDQEVAILREAAERRKEIALKDQDTEIGGANRTTNPSRYGDWEKGGRAIDF